MKYALLALICSALVCHGDGFFTGAQWATKAPTPAQKHAGSIEAFFYDDNTMELDFYYPAGEYVETVSGGYTINGRGDFVFTVLDDHGFVYTGVYNQAKDLLTGTLKSIGGLYKGKFQLTWYEIPPGDANSQGSKSRLSIKKK